MNAENAAQSKETHARRSRKRRELALFLPLLGVLLFASPILDIFADANIDLAHKVLYIFGCWIGLIILAFAVSRALRLEMRKR